MDSIDALLNPIEKVQGGDSLDESIVHYAEHVMSAKSKVGDLEIHLSQLDMGGPHMLEPQKQQMSYYMTEAAYLMPAPAMKPVPLPKTVQLPQPTQQCTGQ